jgi:transposase
VLFAAALSLDEIKTLEEMHKNHWNHAPRIRSHAILLSAKGSKVKKLAEVFDVCRQTIATWLHDWDDGGICGLLDLPRCGRPRILTDEAKVIEYVNLSPRSLKSVLAELAKNFDLNVSHSTLKRVCKRANLTWKRVRKSLKSKRDTNLFEKSRQQLSDLVEQEKQGLIDMYYFDESGFTLEPCVPYAWQIMGETIGIPSSKSKRLNVLGFMNRECTFTSLVFEGTVNSAVVVASIDHFLSTLPTHPVLSTLLKPASLIIDNAPIHTSIEFLENIERWKEQGLSIVPIAPYSPELNLIEILWRKIKYEWMPFSAYLSFTNLKECLFEILASIGKSRSIAFA